MFKIQHKSWLSPFIFVIFAAISITGILMMFHVRVPGFHALHQWGGIAFVVAAIVHLILNWRMFAKYFSNKKAVIGMAAAVLLSVFIVSAAPQGQQKVGDWETAKAQTETVNTR